MTSTIERLTLPDVPALEPEGGKRATVREWRRELAEWLRGYGVAAHGEPWELATTGVRDLAVIRRAGAAAGTMVRHWSGTVPAVALVAGDVTGAGEVVGDPLTDPETGRVWVTVRRVTTGATDHDTRELTATVTDVEYAPDELVSVSRGKGAR